MASTPGPASQSARSYPYLPYSARSPYYFPATPRPHLPTFWRYLLWVTWVSAGFLFGLVSIFVVLEGRMSYIEAKREARERMAIEQGIMRGLREEQIAKIFPAVIEASYESEEPLLSGWDAYFYLTKEKEYYIAVAFDDAGRAANFSVQEIYYYDEWD